MIITSEPRAVRRPLLLLLLGSVAALFTGLAAQEVRDNTAQLVAVVTEEVSSGAPELLLSERGPLAGATEDVCGVCGGDGTRCLGCDGAPSSGHRRDVCGVCRGDGSSCLQSCEVQVQVVTQEWAADILWAIDDGSEHSFGPEHFGDNTDTTVSFTLSEGPHELVFGDSYNDGWNGGWVRVSEPGRGATLTDQVSSTDEMPSGRVPFEVVCLGPMGCDGVPNSGVQYDECNVCGGDGSTCDLRGSGCAEAAYRVSLSARPYSPVRVAVTAEACSTPTLCDVTVRDADADDEDEVEAFALGGELVFVSAAAPFASSFEASKKRLHRPPLTGTRRGSLSWRRSTTSGTRGRSRTTPRCGTPC